MSSVEVGAPSAREPFSDSADWWRSRACDQDCNAALQCRDKVADRHIRRGDRHGVALRQPTGNTMREKCAQHAIVGDEPSTVGVRLVFRMDTDCIRLLRIEPRICHRRDSRHRHLDDGNEDDECPGIGGPKSHAVRAEVNGETHDRLTLRADQLLSVKRYPKRDLSNTIWHAAVMLAARPAWPGTQQRVNEIVAVWRLAV